MCVLGVEGPEKKMWPTQPPPRIISGTALTQRGLRSLYGELQNSRELVARPPNSVNTKLISDGEENFAD